MWVRKAAAQNHAEAQALLGICYAVGEGVAKYQAEAVKWFHKAAEQNFAPAQLLLGKIYDDGDGVAKDQEEAYAWFHLAAVLQPGVEGRDALANEMTSAQIAADKKRAEELRAQIEAKLKSGGPPVGGGKLISIIVERNFAFMNPNEKLSSPGKSQPKQP